MKLHTVHTRNKTILMKWWQLENYPLTAYYPVIVIEDGSPRSLSLNPILRELGRLSEFTKSSVDSQLGTKLDLRGKSDMVSA